MGMIGTADELVEGEIEVGGKGADEGLAGAGVALLHVAESALLVAGEAGQVFQGEAQFFAARLDAAARAGGERIVSLGIMPKSCRGIFN
jgi:hypothetical protein